MDFADIDELLLILLTSERLYEGQHMRTGQPGYEYIQELLGSAYLERVF